MHFKCTQHFLLLYCMHVPKLVTVPVVCCLGVVLFLFSVFVVVLYLMREKTKTNSYQTCFEMANKLLELELELVHSLMFIEELLQCACPMTDPHPVSCPHVVFK